MKEQIENIKKTAIEEIAKAEDLQTLENARVKYLGKKGELTAVLRGMGGLSPEERPIIGGLVNEAKESVEKLIEEKEEKFKAEELNKKLEAEKIDITLPSTKMKRGSLHPVTRIIEDIEDLFLTSPIARINWASHMVILNNPLPLGVRCKVLVYETICRNGMVSCVISKD